MLPDLLIFLHNLPSFLETHPSVNGFQTICQFRLIKEFPDPPRNPQFDLVSFPNISRFDAVEADNATGPCETGVGQAMLLA